MTSKQQKSAKLAALIKKTAQKLVNSPKHLQKLALTLPLLALFVEEVRAAQGESTVFEDLQVLTEFVEAQNLDDTQYAEIEESLDGVQLAANDMASDVAKAAEEEEEKALLLQEEGAAAGKKKAALLEPGSETGAGRGLAAEAEAGADAIAGEQAAAEATESFELAGLVIPVAPVPLVGAVASGLGIVAAGSTGVGGTTTPPAVVDTETATSTTLGKTLKQLKAEGISFVLPATGSSVLNVELGTGAALTNTTGVSLFGDADKSGVISAAEDDALQVNLVITSAAQLAEVAAMGSLAGFGVDSVRIDLSSQALLDALVNNANLAVDLATIRATGVSVNTIDMGVASVLTEAQATTLISSGLSFADDDTITLQADSGTGTHLSSSLKDLQKLGVDAIGTASGTGEISVDFDLGSATSAGSAFSATGLPVFASGLDVTLNVDATQLDQVTGNAAALSGTAHIDHLNINLTDAQAGTSGAGYANELSDMIGSSGFSNLSTFMSSTIDLGGSAVGAVSINQSQAAQLIAEGLHFASADSITLDAALTASNTHLSTSLKDLNKLGVDAVVVSGVNAVNVDLGGLTLADLGSSGAVASFDDALNVTLNVANAAEFGTTAGLASQLHAAHIDNVKIDVLDTDADGDFEDQLISLFDDTSFTAAVTALSVPSVSVGTTLDLGGASVSGELLIHAEQTSGLVDLGIGFAANDQITMDTQMLVGAHSTHLGHTLKDLQKMGVDSLTVVGAATGDDLHIDFGTGTAINLATGGLPQFESNLDVTVHAANGSQLNELGTLANSTGVNLGELGIDVVQLDLTNQTELNQLLPASPSLMAQLAATAPVTTLEGAVTALRADGVQITTIDFAANAGNIHVSESQAQTLLEQGLHFAGNDSITLDAGHTHLSTSLKDLQKLGIDAVSVAGSLGAVDLDLGASSDTTQLQSATLPTFASGLDVTLNVADAAQLDFVAGFGGAANMSLHNSGIDAVKLNLAGEGSLNDLFGAAALDADFTAFQSDLAAVRNHSLDALVVIDQSQADELLNAGLSFSTSDQVEIEASGSHLSTSLRDLKNLGVDSVAFSGADVAQNLSINLGDGPNIDFQTGLPSFDSGINLTLEVANSIQLRQVGGNIDTFAGVGVDAVQLNLASQNELHQFLFEDTLAGLPSTSLMDLTIETVRNNGTVQLDTIDMGGFATEGSAHINSAQIGSIIDAGLHFATADYITLDVNANSTYLSTHTNNLSQLGVDAVHITDAGDLSNLSVVASALVDAGVNTLSLNSANFGVGTTAFATNADAFNWLANGVDFQLHVNSNASVMTDLGAAINIAQSEVNVLTHVGSGLTNASNWGDLIDVLQSSGMSNVEVSASSSVHISDDLSAALYEAGMLHALPSSAFAIDTGDSKVLNTSLKAMADLGVDEVVSAQSVEKLFVGLGDNADIASIIAGFANGSTAPVNDGLFGVGKEAGLVVDQATFDQFNQGDITELLSQLTSLGFTEIDVLKGATDTESYQIINVVAQAPVLSSTVQILGVSDANALLDVFGTDILDKKIS